MPNLGIKTFESMTTWHAKGGLSPHQKTLIKKIFSSFGKEFEVNSDDMIFKATALAGSGPGFLYMIADNFTKTAKKFGFKNDEAETLIKQMFIGAVKTWEASNSTAQEMQEKVTSKKGTTLAGINSFKKSHLPQILEKGLKA
jgi:pyrroline-5-carboxylate reductase